MIWRQNVQNFWVRSQNYKSNQIIKLQKQQIRINLHRNWSNYNELHRFDVKTVKNRKTIKLRSICIDLTSKTSQNILNNAKLQNWSNYNELHRIKNRKTTNWSNYNELHRFDVKTIKTTQNYDQIITNCIDLTSKRSKLLS